jgi:hypothetical protein
VRRSIAVALAAALLAGCGGEDGLSDGGTTTRPPDTSDLRLRADEIRREQERRPGPEYEKEAQPSGSATEAQPPPVEAAHADAGGGAEQFRRPDGDNSIQDFGAEAGDSERAAAAKVLHRYLDSRAAHRWGDACFQLSASVLVMLEQVTSSYGKQGGSPQCEDVLMGIAARAPRSVLEATAQASVGSLRREGDRGYLLYHGPAGQDYVMPMVAEEGGWKVASVDGIPLP